MIVKPIILSAVFTCLCINVSAADKQVSYSVAVPVVKASAAQASSAPAPAKAPVPVIRPINESANQPIVAKPSKAEVKPSTKKEASKSAVKPVVATKASSKKEPTKKEPSKKAPVKKEAVKKVATTKPEAPVKSAAKKPEAARSLKKVESKTVVPQKAARFERKAPEIQPEPMAASKPVQQKVNAGTSPVSMSVASAPAPVPTPTPTKVLVPAAVAATTLAVGAKALETNTHTSAPAMVAAPTSIPAERFSEESLDDLPESDLPVASPVVHKPLAVGGPQEEFVEKFKDYVEESIVPRVPGLALAIIANGQVRVLEAYGVKKSGGKDEITTDTVFRLASVSKTIAGTAAGVLVHSGAASWDTPVTSVLPDVSFSNPKYEAQLTLGHIMSQSTGLPTHSGDNYLEEGQSFDEVVDRLKKISFVCPPGKCYAYQNISFSLLSPIIKKKTGKSYEDYVKEKLFTPLGMRTASYGYDGLVGTRNYAQPHVLVGKGKWYTANVTEHYYRINPAAGANASITDLSRWVLAQMGNNPEVLPPAVLNSIHDHVTKNTPSQSHYGARDGVTNTYYGMGWRMFDYRGDKHFLHHGGYVLGYRSEMVYNPELKIGMVALSNCNRLSGEIIFRFLDAYEDQKRGPMPKKPAAPVKKKKS